MIKIVEVKFLNESFFLKEYVAAGHKQQDSVIKINISKSIVNQNGYDYIILYDENMRVIRDAYKYLNTDIVAKQSFNTRELKGSALKLLYSYLSIFNYDLYKLGKDEITVLKEFLYGENRNGMLYELYITSARGVETVNKYISIYRTYLNFLNIKNEILNEKRVVSVEKGSDGLLGHAKKKIYEKYTVSDRSYSNITVPMYISEDEYEVVLKIIKKEFTLREEIIVRLMFENGLRIGEALGLTLEDIEDSKIVLRNRLSDKSYMFAKTCIKPNSLSDYKSSTYSTYTVGYQIILPSVTLMDSLFYYIDDTHGDMSKVTRKNYFKYAKADKVTEGVDLEGDNYYLFLNKNGAALSISGWNKTVRKIFEKAGLKLDRKTKKHNLNHRFRHGMAMKLVKNGATPYDVLNALRHQSLSSTMCYFRPTEEDMYNANTFASKAMIDKIDK
jgi:site-specific recombinase XerD